MFSKSVTLAQYDPDLAATITQEDKRQQDHVELTASEDYVSCAAMEAQGSQSTNRYAEGYPGKRYYGGREYVDIAEQLVIDHIRKLFDTTYANVQPYSGSQANQTVYTSVLKPGDTILGISLAHGGHLIHGASVNVSGKLYNTITYGLDENEVLDYAEVERLTLEHKPKMIVASVSAYTLQIGWAKFREIADKVGVYLFTNMAHYASLIAGGGYSSPVPFCDFVTTTAHGTLRGPRDGAILRHDSTHEKALSSAIFPDLQGGPLIHAIAAKTVALKEALQPEFEGYTKQARINVVAMTEELVKHGLRIVSGRTESHVFLVDLQPMRITGRAAEAALGKAHVTVNRNAIPNNLEKPFVTSDIRIGSIVVTTRGFNEANAHVLTNLAADVLANPGDEASLAKVRERVTALCSKYPVYGA